ncbi:MAG: nuclease-related domain-containing protein [Neobacillus sp.]
MNINLKDCSESLTLHGLNAAQNRLVAEHPIIPIFDSKRASIEAGIGGEQRVAEIFERYTFPFKNNIIHDLSLSSDTLFQIDHYFFTPYFGLVLDTKNIGGTLEFKDNPPQLVAIKENGQISSFESPVTQLERNLELLTAWLHNRNIYLPLYGAVVLAYPKQIVSVPPTNTTLLFPNTIPPFINSIPQTDRKLNDDAFKWLSVELVKCHRPFIPKPICESYQIPQKDILPGVRCGTCGKIGMIKLPRTWHCRFCKVNDNKAHLRALWEWSLICKRTITNRECREFLEVDNKDTAKRILLSLNLPYQGTFKKRTYFIDPRKFNR